MIEEAFEMQRENFYGAGKNSRFITAKEVYILIGNESAASFTERSKIVRLDQSSTSRRCDAARTKFRTDTQLAATKDLIENRKITCLML